MVLVLAPVRELANQIHEEFQKRFPNTTGDAGIKTGVIFGQMSPQAKNEFDHTLRMSSGDTVCHIIQSPS